MTMENNKPKTGSIMKIVLILSLGLNLAIGSFVIAVVVKGPPATVAPRNQDAVAFLAYALPKVHRREIRRELVARQAELRTNRDALRGLRVEMIEALQQEPFEIEAVQKLLERQRRHFLTLGELAHDALLRRIAELTPEDRAIYVISLQRDARSRSNSN